MTNVLAILILSTGFSVAVETKSGFVERAFPNTALGAEQFWKFAEPLIKEDGNKIKVCTVTLAEDGGAIMSWLLEENFGPALLSPDAYREFSKQANVPPESPSTVAKACLARFPFIRRAK